MAYNNRIGVVVLTDALTGNQYAYRTNIANSVHKGIESYVEFEYPGPGIIPSNRAKFLCWVNCKILTFYKMALLHS